MPDTLWIRFKRWYNAPEIAEERLDRAMEKFKEILSEQRIERIKKMSTVDIEKELHMAKKRVVKFNVSADGKEPGRSEEAGRPFLLRAPLDLNFTGKKEIRLGVTCNMPVLVTRGADTKLFAPGQELRVTVEDSAMVGRSESNFSRGETVAKCFVLDSSDLELQGD